MPPSDLSRLVRDYYRKHFKSEGEEEEFERALAAGWGDLLEAERFGADPGFLLHVLVCTKFQRWTSNIERSPTLQNLPARERAILVGGLRALRRLGWESIKEIFGPAGEEWAQRVFHGIEFIYYELVGITVRNPAWQTGSLAPPTRRQAERPLTACIICIMEELKGRHPKPAAATATLLQKFRLLDRSQGGTRAIEFVRKRARRAAPGVSDLLGPIGNRVWHLRSTYMSLKEFLAPPPVIPDRSSIWVEKARAWRARAPAFRQAFRRFCTFQNLRPTAATLAIFEESLAQTRETGGPTALRQVFRMS